MIKRLKLYNTILKLAIDRKTKLKLKKIAYQNKMTMSEYVRNLIDIAILKYDHEKNMKYLALNSEIMAAKSLRGNPYD